jgi:pimeloyl-ACP methyl ester carboxylesterase
MIRALAMRDLPPDGTVEVTTGRFAYLAAGPESGRLVLCLHGFPDQPESFAPLMAELAAAGYRAVAPWMRGYAPSTLAGPYHAEQLAEDALAIGRALGGGRRFALIGHDWGAVATWAACARGPAELACAVTMAVPHPLAMPERALARGDFALVDRLWRAWSPGFRLEAGPRQRLHRCLAASMPAPIQYYRAIARQLRDPPPVGRIETPVLHLHGSEDGCIEPGAAQRQRRFLNGPFDSELIAQAGHFLQLERPAEVAARALRWLRMYYRPLIRRT